MHQQGGLIPEDNRVGVREQLRARSIAKCLADQKVAVAVHDEHITREGWITLR